MIMESPIRKLQKRNDYQRYKLFRKIKRKKKAAREQEQNIAEKELRKKLKLPKFNDANKTRNTEAETTLKELGIPIQIQQNTIPQRVRVISLDGNYQMETPQYFDEDGNTITKGDDGEYHSTTLKLPEVVVSTKDPRSVFDKSRQAGIARGYESDFSPLTYEEAAPVIDNMPILGDSVQWSQAIKEGLNGNYTNMATLGILGLIPNQIEKPLKSLMRPLKYLYRKYYKYNKHNFKSEIDWNNYMDWFSHRANGEYTFDDILELNKHVPEYKEIERRAKIKDIFLKNDDGTPWDGDIREWIMARSNNAKWLNTKDPFYSGIRRLFYPKNIEIPNFTPEYTGRLWGSDNINVAKSYASPNFGFVEKIYYPNDAKIKHLDANGAYWHSIIMPDGSAKTTDELVDQLTYTPTNADVIKFLNIKDVGPERPMFTNINGTDYIINDKVSRKSLLGNNGKIDRNDLNMYHNSGKDIHIDKNKRGTFTRAAKARGMGVQEFAHKVLSAPKGKYSSNMRKKANFARNASKFKH